MSLNLKIDKEVFEWYYKEWRRQEEGLELIPSENYVSLAILQASGSILTNKYSEGYPFKRYYGGNQFVDQIELLAIERAKKLFNMEHANVQPHSGSTANMAAYFALANFKDKIMGLNLQHGGHLTHGSAVNFSGKLYTFISYGVDLQTHLLDYDEIARIADKEKPKIIVCGYTAYPRQIDFAKFSKIAKECGSYLMVDMAHIAGLIAGEVHPSPSLYADVITSTTHKTLRGPRGAFILSKNQYAQAIDKAVFPGLQGGPLENQIMAKAICFYEAMQPSFKVYAAQIVKNAKALAKALLDLNYDLITGGTDTHLILIDLRSKGLTGKEAQEVLDKAAITTNKNTIPNDPQSPFVTSGLRIGTPAITTRGMKEQEMEQIAHLIDQALKNKNDLVKLEQIKEKVRKLTAEFPIYPNLLN
ncbi:MAG: serine hydroxymethyltransferase [Candidatus Micrarchaeota archaeon]|nr:serine hydroxymethyltransferase [Candidatus Micrarchaeota archaeon]